MHIVRGNLEHGEKSFVLHEPDGLYKYVIRGSYSVVDTQLSTCAQTNLNPERNPHNSYTHSRYILYVWELSRRLVWANGAPER